MQQLVCPVRPDARRSDFSAKFGGLVEQKAIGLVCEQCDEEESDCARPTGRLQDVSQCVLEEDRVIKNELYPVENEGDCADQDVEEEVRFRTRRAMAMPTKEEREKHAVTHLPYRSWCEVCVAARGVATGHRQRSGPDEREVPSLSLDYCFLRREPGGEALTTLVMKDRLTQAICAHVVPAKGADTEWVTQQIVRDIKRLGYFGRVILRSDQEPAIVAFLEQVARSRADEPTVLEHSPVGDSQSNGAAERAVRSLEEMMRTYLIDLERRANFKVPINHPLMEWLVEHSADMLNKCSHGSDGRSPYQRIKGRAFHGELAPFGSAIMFRVVGKVKGGELTDRWLPGVWLGKRFASDEHLVALRDSGRVFRCRSIQALGRAALESELLEVVGRPCNPAGTIDSSLNAPPRRADDRAIPPDQEPISIQPRNLYITDAVLEKFGLTEGCKKCRLIGARRNHKGIGHSAECRARLEELILNDPVMNVRLQEAEARKTRYLAEEVERSVRHVVRREVAPASSASSTKRTLEPGDLEVDVPVALPEAIASSAAPGSSGSSLPTRGGEQRQPHTPAPEQERHGKQQQEQERPGKQDREAEQDEAEPGAKRSKMSGECRAPAASKASSTGSGASGASLSDSSSSSAPAPMEMEVGPGKRAAEEPEEHRASVRRRLEYLAQQLHAVWPADDGEDTPEMEAFDYETDEWLNDLTMHQEDLAYVPKDLIVKAMEEELDNLRAMHTFAHVKEEQASADPDGVRIDSRWVFVNKGSRDQPKIKGRLVAREFASRDGRGDLFAGTPGLAAIRSVVSEFCTDYSPGDCLGLMDIKGAFLYGKARRSIYVRMPDGQLVKLLRSLYGTRDAPQIWADHLAESLKSLGFTRSVTNPSIWRHHSRRLVLAVHVDDILVAGPRIEVKNLAVDLEKRYTLKKAFVGAQDDHVGEFLGRKLEWTSKGVNWTHGKKYVRQLLQDYGMLSCRPTSTPVNVEDHKVDDANGGQAEPMDQTNARLFRAAAAKVNYLAQDRPDLSLASNMVARSMSNPMRGDEVKMKRLLRYLQGRPVCTVHYAFQPRSQPYFLYTDSDWASCRQTRRSTSGGLIFHGSHLLHHWSRLQGKIAPSSGEAELFSGNVGLSNLAGILNLAQEISENTINDLEVKHFVDAAACRGILVRQGAGSIKHLEVRDLWGQELVKRLGAQVIKIPRSQNVADLLASASAPAAFEAMVGMLPIAFPPRDRSP